ncbi:hypothetical protein J6590_002091 [Homalodisca vitripennis]|nr:hypothetical protein J6590_002091 [Homalodisca vitripennis]
MWPVCLSFVYQLNLQVFFQEIADKRSHVPVLPNENTVQQKEPLVYQHVGWAHQPVTTYSSPVRIEQSSTAIYTFPSFTEKFIIENIDENKLIYDPKNNFGDKIELSLECLPIIDDLTVATKNNETLVEDKSTDLKMKDAEGKNSSGNSRKQWQEFFKPPTLSSGQTDGGCTSEPLLASEAPKNSNAVTGQILHHIYVETKSTIGSEGLRTESASILRSISQTSDTSLPQ